MRLQWPRPGINKMKLISESIENDIEYIIENDAEGKEKNYSIRGPFLQAEIKNRNNRRNGLV